MLRITLLRFGVIVALALGMFTAGPAVARKPLSDAPVGEAVIRESIVAYLATEHACACPYNVARNGSSCGARSRPGGAPPLLPGGR